MSADMETKTKPNVGELVAIYQHIKTHPEQWHQGWWGVKGECGTAYCVAGHAVVRAGATPLWVEDDFFDEGVRFDFVQTADGQERGVEKYASELLGLTASQGDDLFGQSNGIYRIRDVIIEITGVDPETAEVQS